MKFWGGVVGGGIMRDYEGWFSLNGEYGNNNYGEGISWYYFKGWINLFFCVRMMFYLE